MPVPTAVINDRTESRYATASTGRSLNSTSQKVCQIQSHRAQFNSRLSIACQRSRMYNVLRVYPRIAARIGAGAGCDADGVSGVVAAEAEEPTEGGGGAVQENCDGDDRLQVTWESREDVRMEINGVVGGGGAR